MVDIKGDQEIKTKFDAMDIERPSQEDFELTIKLLNGEVVTAAQVHRTNKVFAYMVMKESRSE